LVLSVWRGIWVSYKTLSSPNNPRRHTILEQAHDIALYSDSVDDFETQECFLLFQEIRASPRNIHQPTIKWQVSTQPAQLGSLKPTKCKDLSERKNKLWLDISLRYWRKWQTTAKYIWHEACINQLTCWTINDISSRVMVKYSNCPPVIDTLKDLMRDHHPS